MRNTLALLWLVPTLCFTPCLAWADMDATPVSTTWMTVLLNGRKIGQQEIQRQRAGDVVTTTQTLVVDVERNDKTVPYTNVSRSTETAGGKPLGFAMSSVMSATETRVEGTLLPDGRLQLASTVGGATRQETTDWPQGALLVEGQRLAMRAAIDHPGMRYRLLSFNQASEQAQDLSVEVLGNERVRLPDGIETLSHQRETLKQPRGTQTVDIWLDAQGNVRKGVLTLLGQPLDMLACSEACAKAPTQSVDMMRAAMVMSPRDLAPYLRDGFLRYLIHVDGDASRQPFIDTDEQHVRRVGHDEWEVDVDKPHPGNQAPPDARDTQPNAWLQSDSPTIRALAARAVWDARSDAVKMRRMQDFVSKYITQHGLDVGYASALEVAHDREGDCAEYAVLLAAMARAEGIPARVVTGMVYADRYTGGGSRVFLPHAWVEAWVNHRWRSYDGATHHFDTGHIALDSGDGDPWHFFNAANQFAGIRIDSIQSISELSPVPVPQPPQPMGGMGGARK